MKMNKKGFTLMELLATVVILGIISTIGIVSVNKVLKKSHKEYEVKQAKMVTTAAQSYFADNKSMLPLEVLTTKTVTLQELINKNYIGKVVDYKKREYDYQRSITTVRKMAANRYVYYSALYRNGEEKAAVDENPEKMDSSAITINLSLSDNNSYKKYNNDTSYYVKEKTPVDVKMSSSDKIAAYKYIIYKVVGSTEKKYKNSENIVIDKNSYDDKIVLSKENLTDGKYKLEVVAYGYDGIPNRKSISQIVIDATKPKCEIKVKKGTKGNNVENLTNVKWYIKDDLEIQMIQKDENLYKYKLNGGEYKESTESSIPINFNSYLNNKVVEGYSIDKAGNICTCNSEPIYYDPTPPNCPTEISNSNWTNQKVTLTGKCNDSGSDCVEKEITKEIDYEVNEDISPGIAKDKAGNSTTCEKKEVKIDKTAPECITSIEGTHSGYYAWYKSDVKFVGYCFDTGGSICKENSVDWTYRNNTEGGKWGSAGIVEDNAGNKKNCDSYIYGIDTLAPTCGTPVNGVVSCTDNYGGSGTNDISYDQEESGEIDLGYCIDNVGNSSHCGTVTLTNTPETETAEDCSIDSISITNESQGKWWNKKLKLLIEWNTNDKVKKLVRTYDGAESEDISVGENDTSYTTGNYTADRNTKVCYQLVTSNGCKSKICTRVKIDKTDPIVSRVCMCKNTTFASSGGIPYKYVLKLELSDKESNTVKVTSGLKSSTWKWSSDGGSGYNHEGTNSFYNGRKYWYGYIGVSKYGGPYEYTIRDIAGNSSTGRATIPSSLGNNCDCSAHT